MDTNGEGWRPTGFRAPYKLHDFVEAMQRNWGKAAMSNKTLFGRPTNGYRPRAPSQQKVYKAQRSLDLVGNFHAYQGCRDMVMYQFATYDPAFVRPGPGAIVGLNILMGENGSLSQAQTKSGQILYLTKEVNRELLRRDALRQSDDILKGRGFGELRPCDLEHQLCEFQRYLRWKRGEGGTGRRRAAETGPASSVPRNVEAMEEGMSEGELEDGTDDNDDDEEVEEQMHDDEEVEEQMHGDEEVEEQMHDEQEDEGQMHDDEEDEGQMHDDEEDEEQMDDHSYEPRFAFTPDGGKVLLDTPSSSPSPTVSYQTLHETLDNKVHTMSTYTVCKAPGFILRFVENDSPLPLDTDTPPNMNRKRTLPTSMPHSCNSKRRRASKTTRSTPQRHVNRRRTNN
ncbi:hypothetical protein HDV00_003313 [Rhizophlyctis rosea]|nr:hypothetical protein HDV00_003313 [Rhizophlyctis rosea]